MYRALLLASAAFLLPSMPQAPDSRPAHASFTVRSIEACRVYLTAAGRSAAFADTAIYEVVAATSGAVTQVRPVKVSSAFASFVQVDAFHACAGRWTFSGPGTAVVAFSAGTSGEFLTTWKVSVTTDGRVLTLVLPLGKN